MIPALLLAVLVALVLYKELSRPERKKRPITWRGVLFHCAGIALIANNINAYAFPLLFPRCGSSDLRISCSAYGSGLAPVLNFLGDLHVINLLLRFMALAGFLLDILALAYIFIVIRNLVAEPRYSAEHGPGPL